MKFATVLTGFLTGFPVMIAVGPIALLLIEQGLERGVRRSAPAAFGVAAADLTFATLSALVGTVVVQALESYTWWLRIGSAVLMGALAWKLGRSALMQMRSNQTAIVPAAEPEMALVGGGSVAVGAPVGNTAHDFPLGSLDGARLAGGFFGLTIVNPLTIVVFVGIVAAGGAGVGTLGWVLGMTLASLTVHSGFVVAGRVRIGSALGDGAAAKVRLGAAVLMVLLAGHFLLG